MSAQDSLHDGFVYENGTMVLPVGTLRVEHMLTLLTLLVSTHSQLLSAVDETGALALHISCQNPKIPIQVIQFLVDQNPTSVHQKDNQGNLPMHTLCASHPQWDTVKYMHSKHPESVTATNRQGHSPFDVASLASASMDILWFLMDANPSCAIANLYRSS